MNMTGTIVCYVPFIGMTQLAMNSIIHFNVFFFSDEIVKYINEVYFQHPDEYTLMCVLDTHNKSILSKLIEFIDLIMKIFEHRSSWDTDDIVQD